MRKFWIKNLKRGRGEAGRRRWTSGRNFLIIEFQNTDFNNFGTSFPRKDSRENNLLDS